MKTRPRTWKRRVSKFAGWGGRLGSVWLLLAATIVFGHGEPPLHRFEYEQLQMGTRFRLVLYARNEGEAAGASRAAFDRIEDLEQILSDYRPDSELRQVSRNAAEAGQVVSRELFTVLEAACRLARLSHGAFDVTVRPLVELWRKAGAEGRLPTPLELGEARRRTGFEKILLNPRLQSVRFRQAGMALDLGGIAKGYAADQALEVLRAHGVSIALVDAGGDLRLGEPPPGSAGWVVGSDPETGDVLRYRLRSTAIATSSDTYRHYDIGGERFSHIVDPRTGLGVRHRGTVMVIAPDAMTADGLATALSVLLPSEGEKLMSRFPGAAARVVRLEEGRPRVYRTGSFPP